MRSAGREGANLGVWKYPAGILHGIFSYMRVFYVDEWDSNRGCRYFYSGCLASSDVIAYSVSLLCIVQTEQTHEFRGSW